MKRHQIKIEEIAKNIEEVLKRMSNNTAQTIAFRYMNGSSPPKLPAVAALIVCLVAPQPPSGKAQDSSAPVSSHDPASIYIQAGADKAEIAKIRQLAAEFEAKARTNYTALMTSVKEMQK